MINELGYWDSNPEIQESKSCALPFGDTPLNTSDIPSFILRIPHCAFSLQPFSSELIA